MAAESSHKTVLLLWRQGQNAIPPQVLGMSDGPFDYTYETRDPKRLIRFLNLLTKSPGPTSLHS